MKHSVWKAGIHWKCSLKRKPFKCKASLKTLTTNSDIAEIINDQHNHRIDAYKMY